MLAFQGGFADSAPPRPNTAGLSRKHILAAVEAIAEGQERSISQIALAWHLSNPLVTSPIIGPRTLEQLADNLGAAGLRLSEDDMAALNQASAWEE